MQLPPDATLRDRMVWAALAAIIGVVHDGPEVGTEQRLFQRLETACRSFGVPADSFDACAKLLDFHYYRPWDTYLDRATLAQVEGRGAAH
jgi:hypothetical protein